MYLPVSESGGVPVDASGAPVFLSSRPEGPVVELAGFSAVGVSNAQAARLGSVRECAYFAAQPPILRAIALVRNRREQRFDPRTGRALSYPTPGIVGRDAQDPGREVYPRLDPAVIGLIIREGAEEILLARSRRRPEFFTLIAGYVEPGERLEEALVREVLEETGRRARAVTYWGSRPWPHSGSVMVGFRARTADADPVRAPDGELLEARWVSRAQLPALPIARKGTIAREMIMEWYRDA